MVLDVDVVVPDGHDCERVPESAEHQVEVEEKKVSEVFIAEAVVDPGTVMVHPEDTAIAGPAVVSPGGLDVVADFAPACPECLKIVSRFRPKHEQCLDLRMDTFKPFSSEVERDGTRLVRHCINLQILTRLLLLVIMTQLLGVLCNASKLKL